MAKLDLFTRRRLTRFIEEFRHSRAQLPTLSDLEANGFPKVTVTSAIKEKIIQELYVTLTSGAVVKGYKVSAN